jgi:hypothetical protein
MEIRETADYQSIVCRITSDPRYQANLDWGRPRRGHPEATIRAHIAELEGNLEKLKPSLSESDYWKLKLLIHVHDSVKPDCERCVAITHPKSHASLARAFLAEFCDDTDLLAIVQSHDEPYALFRQFKARGTYDETRLARLLENIKDWNLFLSFVIIDGCTDGKSREPLRWFFGEIVGKVQSTFTEVCRQ